MSKVLTLLLMLTSCSRIHDARYSLEVLLPWKDVILVATAILSAVFAWFTHRRSKQLFVVQRRPLIQVRPIAVKEILDPPAIETVLAVGNYSGFTARDISVDLRYGKNDSVVEWLRADADDINKHGKTAQNYYPVSQGFIDRLKPCKSIIKHIRGSFKLDYGNREVDVVVKAVWKNDKGFIFEKRWEYKLICTRVRDGKSFDFSLQKAVGEDC